MMKSFSGKLRSRGRIRRLPIVYDNESPRKASRMTPLQPYIVKTTLWHVDPHTPDLDIIRQASDVLHRGGLVSFPTETVYGLGANALDESAVSKIFRAKGRPANDPIIIHIAHIDQLRDIAVDIPDMVSTLTDRFWAGALTLVLKKHPNIPLNITAGMESVAVRMPDHPVALALLRRSGLPIGAPSANTFSRPSPTTAQHVMDDLDGHVDIVLDGGGTSIGVESTILSLVSDVPTLLRPGGVSLEALRQVLPHIMYHPQYLAEDVSAAPSAGTLLKHYSPTADVILFRGDDDATVFSAMRDMIRESQANNRPVGVMVLDADVEQFAGLDVTIVRLGASVDESALHLFSALRDLDKQGIRLILARAPEQTGLGLAVWDRLVRASVGHVIEV
jgi:L-threonylcarbamoyladenylate synthase